MKRVVVAGAGGYGREMADALAVLEARGEQSFGGFIDDDQETYADHPDYLGPIEAASVPDGCDVIISVGDPVVRLRLADRLTGDVSFATVLHPTAVISPSAAIGEGTFVAPFGYVGPAAVVGKHAAINIYAAVAHDATLGDFAVLSPYASLNGHAVVGRGCFMGTGAAVTIGLEIGEWSKVSMGAAVTRSMEACSLASGVPAKSRVMFKPPE